MTVTGVALSRVGIPDVLRQPQIGSAPQSFAAPVQECETQPSPPSPEYSFAVNLRFWPDTGWFWPRAHVFKELEFVARSLSRYECRTFSSLELAS